MRPLDGITVVTIEHAIAAPVCTQQLAAGCAAARPEGGQIEGAKRAEPNGTNGHTPLSWRHALLVSVLMKQR